MATFITGLFLFFGLFLSLDRSLWAASSSFGSSEGIHWMFSYSKGAFRASSRKFELHLSIGLVFTPLSRQLGPSKPCSDFLSPGILGSLSGKDWPRTTLCTLFGSFRPNKWSVGGTSDPKGWPSGTEAAKGCR